MMKNINKEQYKELLQTHNDWLLNSGLSNYAPFRELTLSNMKFEKDRLQKATFNICRFINCTFNNVDFSDACFIGIEFLHCTFIGCNFTSTQILMSKILYCEFKACSLVSVQFIQTQLKKVKFIDNLIYLGKYDVKLDSESKVSLKSNIEHKIKMQIMI